MLYDDLHWRRGRPSATGTYLVYDGDLGTVRVATVTGLAPFAYRTGRIPSSNPWRFRAYLGPLGPRHVTGHAAPVAS